jgi:hypothetical protein
MGRVSSIAKGTPLAILQNVPDGLGQQVVAKNAGLVKKHEYMSYNKWQYPSIKAHSR